MGAAKTLSYYNTAIMTAFKDLRVHILFVSILLIILFFVTESGAKYAGQIIRLIIMDR
jgi:hypothetical protein